MFDVGKRIKELRLQKGLTGQQLAIELSFSQGFLSGLEQGKKKCSLENLNSICNVLGCSLSDFFKEEEPTLSLDQQNLLDTYKTLNNKQKKAVIDLVNLLAKS